MKIYEYEIQFLDAWEDAIEKIIFKSNSENPLTLKEVLEFGFNKVYFEDEQGFDDSDFSSSSLDKKVVYDYWDTDFDGYRFIVLKEYEK